MSEKYISESKLKAHYSWLGKDATLSPKDVDDIIDAQPAADVEPVVRGEWIEMRDPYGDLTGWIHEECGHETQCASNYCSKCGAKMKLIERSGNGEQINRT